MLPSTILILLGVLMFVIVVVVQQTVSKLDEELRAKASSFQTTNQAIAAEKKKTS